ncbi:MAG: carbonic anhydrase [Betaproteobacteria bacterium]|nr:MAG: carbonic anhydrase [Betaproteobacteria bacterium]
MKDIEELVSGFRRFQRHYFDEHRELFEQLVRQGQAPRVMVIGCSDSRVDPAIILDCDPGDLFVVRNVANLVPPHETGGGYHGTSAALEFAVRGLRVRHVVVLGHAHCGGIRALMGELPLAGGAEFIGPWMSIADPARRAVARDHAAASFNDQARACELEAVRVSLENLASFPFVREAVARGRLAVHGWYFDIEQGALLRFDRGQSRFEAVVEGIRVG